ncbi:MAG: gamma-glutamylcyclotransferase [Pseudomonadota bacterium]
MGDFWVFGYGSLMWRPGFNYLECETARIHGLHRALCIYSWVHRGTKERPGLVLGLDRGGSCLGRAFRVEEKNRDEVIAYLRERELVTNVYVETWRRVQLQSGATASALVYITDRTNPQYAGRLPENALVKQISGASGRSGDNEDYVLKTAEHLEEIGIEDVGLQQVARRLRNAN